MNMYTVPDYRRQDITFRTLDLLVKAAKKQNVLQIGLKATAMGRLLYEKYGFMKMEWRLIVWGDKIAAKVITIAGNIL